MAENNIESTVMNTEQQVNSSSFKRRFEKLKSKFFELFFVSNNKSMIETNIMNANKKSSFIERSSSTNTLNSSMLISNCYYGYKSSLIESFEQDYNSNENSNLKKMNTNSSSSSLNSPLASQNKNILSLSLSSASSSTSSIDQQSSVVITSEYINSNNELESCNQNGLNENNNPFLNTKYTDLIHFNSDLNLLNSHFKSSLNLIDDQDNFFNIDFMINYISYILLANIKHFNDSKSVPILKQVTNIDVNLLKEIARQTYQESENEPCGLKGCQMNVYLEKSNENSLITQFRFDSTCSLTTFELNLTLKQLQTNKYDLLMEQSGVNSTNQSSITNLTRRLLTASSSTKSKHQKQNSKAISVENIVFIDSINFDLCKRKLY